jgi:hypothetical protein
MLTGDFFFSQGGTMSDGINGFCILHEDREEYEKCNWPTVFVGVPRIGDIVTTRGEDPVSLVVHLIAHCEANEGEKIKGCGDRCLILLHGTPYIKVFLE